MAKKIKLAVVLTLLTILVIIIIGVFTYYEFFYKEELAVKEVSEKEIDNRISPLTNQGLTVEILRIRNRELMDRMLRIGTSWKNKPTFFWVTVVDGKESDSSVALGSFNEWDTILKEYRVNYYVEEEQETSDITITIMEDVKSGLFGLRTKTVERATIDITYDYRTGRWDGDDSQRDFDGYGHYRGEIYDIWFNIYQSDFDHDGIPYWTEVNVLDTDPRVDDSLLDPDGDSCPTAWEWQWGYNPYVWDDHEHLDPDVDGIENVEEYQMRKWFANPYKPDIYIEADGMEKGGFFDWNHVFYEESQQMLIERFAQHNINIYIDYGWPDSPVNGGGELLPFVKVLDDVVGGTTRFYLHNFPDERKGIFRYLVVANDAGWAGPSKYNYYDAMVIDTPLGVTIINRLAPTPRHQRVTVAKSVLHELGHTLGLMPYNFKGNDIMPKNIRWPDMTDEEHKNYAEQYHSIMNYNYIWMDRFLFDYSDGTNGPPYDQDDWEHFYLPTFQLDSIAYEEPIDETFADLEVVDEDPGIELEGWVYDANLTREFDRELDRLVFIENVECTIMAYTKTTNVSENCRDVRVYVMPQVHPVHATWSLVAEGNLGSDGSLEFFSLETLIEDVIVN